MTEHEYSLPRSRGFHLRRRLRRLVARCAARMSPRAAPPGQLGILTYHRIVPPVLAGDRPSWAVTPARLSQQLSALRTYGYRPLPLTEACRAHRRREPLAARAFVVTFDDGYENNYLHAVPVLQRWDTPATLFVATGYLDTCVPFPFDDWPAAQTRQAPPDYWRPLTRDQCHGLQTTGLFELGSHTHSHRNFLQRAEEFRADLACSFAVLRDEFGVESPSFSYPFGAIDPDLDGVVRHSGASCALTSFERCVASDDDPFAWGRFNVEYDDDGATLTAKLDGRYSALCNKVRRWLVFGTASRRPAAGSPSLPSTVRTSQRERAGTGCTPEISARLCGLGASDDDHIR